MSKSPLSGAFAGSSEPAKKNKKNGALLLISGIALATSIGGVFAANSITINNGSDIEFGQGIADTTSCTEDATTTMSQEFSAGEFYVDLVSLSTSADCSGVDVIVSLIDASNGVLHATTAAAGPAAGATIEFDLSTLQTRILANAVAKIAVTTAPNVTP
jgi:hypothetical protein